MFSTQRKKQNPDTRALNRALNLALSFSVSILLAACQNQPDAGTQGGQASNDTNSQNAVVREVTDLKLPNLKLDVSESSLNKSQDFAFFPGGHFGDKTQYNGKTADEFGGAYAVHCRAGKPFAIEVKYPGTGIKRDDAMKVMNRLLPDNPGAVTEHDDEDLQKMDAKQAAEFFYFKTGPRSELLYADNSKDNVVQVNVWTKDG